MTTFLAGESPRFYGGGLYCAEPTCNLHPRRFTLHNAPLRAHIPCQGQHCVGKWIVLHWVIFADCT